MNKSSEKITEYVLIAEKISGDLTARVNQHITMGFVFLNNNPVQNLENVWYKEMVRCEFQEKDKL